jgi:hypothetical protein
MTWFELDRPGWEALWLFLGRGSGGSQTEGCDSHLRVFENFEKTQHSHQFEGLHRKFRWIEQL